MNRIITQFPKDSARPVKKARNGATNIIVDTDGTLLIQSFDGTTVAPIPAVQYAVYTVKTTIPASGVTSLNSTPVTIVPSPGAGAFIEPISAVMYLHNATTPYSANTGVTIQFDTLTSPVFTIGIADTPTVAGQLRACVPYKPDTGESNIISNKNLNLWAPSGNPSGGDGALTIWLTYKIVSL